MNNDQSNIAPTESPLTSTPVPTVTPYEVQKKPLKLYRIIITLLLIACITLAGVIVYLFVKDTPSEPEPSPITLETTPTPTIETTPTETTILPSQSPTPTVESRKTITLVPDLEGFRDKVTISMVLPETAKVTELPGGKLHDSKIDIPEGYPYSHLEINDTTNTSTFKLIIGLPTEGIVRARPNVVNLAPTEYFTELYRSRVSTTDPSVWGYATSARASGQCKLYYSDNFVDAPCSSNEVVFPNPNPNNGTKMVHAFCETKTEAGLVACDQIIKSLRYVE